MLTQRSAQSRSSLSSTRNDQVSLRPGFCLLFILYLLYPIPTQTSSNRVAMVNSAHQLDQTEGGMPRCLVKPAFYVRSKDLNHLAEWRGSTLISVCWSISNNSGLGLDKQERDSLPLVIYIFWLWALKSLVIEPLESKTKTTTPTSFPFLVLWIHIGANLPVFRVLWPLN